MGRAATLLSALGLAVGATLGWLISPEPASHSSRGVAGGDVPRERAGHVGAEHPLTGPPTTWAADASPPRRSDSIVTQQDAPVETSADPGAIVAALQGCTDPGPVHVRVATVWEGTLERPDPVTGSALRTMVEEWVWHEGFFRYESPFESAIMDPTACVQVQGPTIWIREAAADAGTQLPDPVRPFAWVRWLGSSLAAAVQNGNSAISWRGDSVMARFPMPPGSEWTGEALPLRFAQMEVEVHLDAEHLLPRRMRIWTPELPMAAWQYAVAWSLGSDGQPWPVQTVTLFGTVDRLGRRTTRRYAWRSIRPEELEAAQILSASHATLVYDCLNGRQRRLSIGEALRSEGLEIRLSDLDAALARLNPARQRVPLDRGQKSLARSRVDAPSDDPTDGGHSRLPETVPIDHAKRDSHGHDAPMPAALGSIRDMQEVDRMAEWVPESHSFWGLGVVAVLSIAIFIGLYGWLRSAQRRRGQW